jgi:hypothetical protein
MVTLRPPTIWRGWTLVTHGSREASVVFLETPDVTVLETADVTVGLDMAVAVPDIADAAVSVVARALDKR